MLLKKILCVVAATCIMVCSFSSCSVKSEPVYTLNDVYIDEGMYSYWLSFYKTSFYSTFLSGGSFTDASYTEDFWDTKMSDEVTIGEIAKKQIDTTIKQILACLKLYEENKLTLSEQAYDDIKASLDDDISDAGSRSALNKELAECGINIDKLEDIYEIGQKCTVVADYYWGDNGCEKITDNDKEEYYQENYSRIKHILINTVNKYVLDEKGNPVMDTSTGTYKTTTLDKAELDEKKTLVNELYEKVNNGEDFDSLIEKYGEDDGSKTYTDGYYISENSSYDEDFQSCAMEMAVGEVRVVESEYGTHIIKKYPLEKGAYGKDVNADFFKEMETYIKQKKKEEKLAPYIEQITINEEALEKYTYKQAIILK